MFVAQKIWFVHSKEIVNGPFDTDTVKQQLSQKHWDVDSCLIWCKGQREWLPLNKWQSHLEQGNERVEESAQNPIWYIDNGSGTPVGPLTKQEMFTHLRGMSNIGKVRLWTAGMKHWTILFELPDIVDELGMSRREHNRAPLLGTVAITSISGNASTLITKAATISIGGCGLTEALGLTRGDDIQLVIKSTEFANPLRVQGTVLYVTQKGYAGVKFHQVHSETHALIFDYVKKFMGGTTTRKSA